MDITDKADRPSKRLTRRKVLGAALALSAAAGVAGVTTAGTAGAVTHDPGYVDVPSTNVTPDSAGVDWGHAWDTCRKQYPGTHSVEYRYTWNSDKATKMQVWLCKESK